MVLIAALQADTVSDPNAFFFGYIGVAAALVFAKYLIIYIYIILVLELLMEQQKVELESAVWVF